MKKLLLLLLCCVLLLTACAFASAEVSLTSINVGKADCHLLTLGEQVFMIDTGSAESWGMVSRALKILGIDHLNVVILTHTDKDHAGGMQALAISSIKVDAWYSSAYYTDVKEKKHPAVKAAALRGAQVQWLQAGDTIPAGAYTLQVLAPSSLDEDNENNNSVVLYLQAAEGSLLLMGDTEEGGEAELLTEGAAAKSHREDATGKGAAAKHHREDAAGRGAVAEAAGTGSWRKQPVETAGGKATRQ